MATAEPRFYQLTWISTVCEHLSYVPPSGQGLTQRVGYDSAHCHSRDSALTGYGWW